MTDYDPTEEQEEEQESQLKSIESTGSVTTEGRHQVHCLTIIGQVEGHYILPPQNKTTKYEHVIPQLVAIEENPDIRGLLVILNTVGGDVEAGLAIAELIAGMKTPTVSLVLGGGHSIGVPLAVSAKQSFIVPSATMTIREDERVGAGSASEFFLFSENARPNRPICYGKFPYYSRSISGIDDDNR